MKIYRSLEEIPFQRSTALTVGTFDGVHLGHQKIIDRLVSSARGFEGRSMLITFDPHPAAVLKGITDNYLLTLPEEKLTLLRDDGVDAVFMIPFSREFAGIEPASFIDDWLIRRIGVTKMIAGFNHAFGKARGGTDDLLEQLGKTENFSLDIIEPVQAGEINVSSTRIREALWAGNAAAANRMLGRNFSLTGLVINGNTIGGQLGFPTANVLVNKKSKIIPADGVYAAAAVVDGTRYKGMVNIGNKPTIPESTWGIEIHIFDFQQNVYNKKIEVEFINRHRSERQFNSRQDLAAQLQKDRSEIAELLSDHT